MSRNLVDVQSAERGNDIPFGVYKREQARIARRRLYPLTIFYSLFTGVVSILAARSAHPFLSLDFYAFGLLIWTLSEYLFHRYILHGRFPAGDSLIKKFLHERFDPLHWEHHARPFDGNHISGELKDLLPLFLVAAPVSLLFPIYSVPILLAGTIQSYVGEEWLHYFLHYAKSRIPYFRYLKKYHLYHHSQRGMNLGYGITTPIWDFVFRTPFPRSIRNSLFRHQSARV